MTDTQVLALAGLITAAIAIAAVLLSLPNIERLGQ